MGGPLKVEKESVQRKHVLGGMVFGAGWAVTGTCPGPAIAMVAGGGLIGLIVVAGLTVGVFLRDWVAMHSTAPRLNGSTVAPRDASPVPPVA